MRVPSAAPRMRSTAFKRTVSYIRSGEAIDATESILDRLGLCRHVWYKRLHPIIFTYVARSI